MKPGRHAVTDTSFVKSAGGAGARGLVLLAVALLIGVVLLNATDADPPGSTIAAKGDSDTAGGARDTGGDGEGKATPTTAAVVTTTTLAPRAPKDVKVIVANASPTKGAAGTAGAQLKPLGYNVLAPSNAAAVNESSVYFVPGFDRDAAAVAIALKLPPTSVKPVPAPPPFELNTANVAVVLGATDAVRFAPGGTPATTAPPAPGATTTAKPATGATTTTAKPAAGVTTTTAKPAAGVTTTSTAPTTTSTTKKP